MPQTVDTRVELLEQLRGNLLRHYFVLLVPAAALALLGLVLRFFQAQPVDMIPLDVAGPVVLIVAVVLALASPLWMRVRFVGRVAEARSVDTPDFLAFEKNLLNTALPATWVAALGYLLGVSLFHFAGATLAALYAAYYYFPSRERVTHEMRLFRVGRESA